MNKEDIQSSEVEIRVSSNTGHKDLAKAITSNIRQGRRVTLVAIGHRAIAQGMKAVPLVNGFLVSKGTIYTVFPAYQDRIIVDDDTQEELERTVFLMKIVQYAV